MSWSSRAQPACARRPPGPRNRRARPHPHLTLRRRPSRPRRAAAAPPGGPRPSGRPRGVSASAASPPRPSRSANSAPGAPRSAGSRSPMRKASDMARRRVAWWTKRPSPSGTARETDSSSSSASRSASGPSRSGSRRRRGRRCRAPAAAARAPRPGPRSVRSPGARACRHPVDGGAGEIGAAHQVADRLPAARPPAPAARTGCASAAPPLPAGAVAVRTGRWRRAGSWPLHGAAIWSEPYPGGPLTGPGRGPNSRRLDYELKFTVRTS